MSYHHAVFGPEGDGTDLWGNAEYRPIHRQTALAEHVLWGFENPPQLEQLSNNAPLDDELVGFVLEPDSISAEDVWEHKAFERDVVQQLALEQNDGATPEEVENYLSRIGGTDIGFIGVRRALVMETGEMVWHDPYHLADRSWKCFRKTQCRTTFNRQEFEKE